MRRRTEGVALFVAFIAALLAATPAAASNKLDRSFSGNACLLFSAKQIAAIVGDSSAGKYACVSEKSVKTPAGTTYTAHAGSGTVSKGGFFSIQVVKYANASFETLVQNGYKKRLKPVPGIGDWCYSHIAVTPVFGGTADNGQFVFGAKGYGILINVRAVLKKSVNQAALKSLAKEIVGKL